MERRREEEALVRALVGHGRASRARRTGSARTRANWVGLGPGVVPTAPGSLRRIEVKEAIRTCRLVLRNGRRLTEMPYCLTVTTVKIKPDGTGRHLAGRHQAYIERMVVHGDGRVEPDPAEEIICAAGNIAGDTLSRCRFWDAVEAREARKTPLRQDGGRSYDKPVQIRMILELPYGLADAAYGAIADELVRRIEGMTPGESQDEGYRLRCHAVVHAPPGKELTGSHADEQARNVHMHLLLHDRPARREADSSWGSHRHKCLELGRKGAIERTKTLMCEIINPYMERHGLGWRYHPGSFRDSGLDLEPLMRVPPSYLQRTAGTEGEPVFTVKINRMLIDGREQEVRDWQHRRQRDRRDAREKAARLRAHHRAEQEERQRVRKWKRAERLAEACDAVVVPARPKHRFHSYEDVKERIYEEITHA